MVQKRGTILLWILNFVFPGAALFWRKQALQGICYIFAFGIVNAFRHELVARTCSPRSASLPLFRSLCSGRRAGGSGRCAIHRAAPAPPR